MSNDRADLLTQIDAFHMFDGTATKIAMKWGLHGLDPAFRETLNTLHENGALEIDEKFASRPSDDGDKGTLKIIVLMADGEVVAQQRPNAGKAINAQPATSKEKSATVKEALGKSTTVSMMTAACSAAKKHGIIILAVGFEVENTNFLEKLRGCASSNSHYYDTKASSLNSVFQDIARSIEKIPLVSY